ncbi:MAG: MFS transporter [Pseudomonadota bacterium]
MTIITDDNRRWWVAGAMALPLVVLTLDYFGVSVALPAIGRDLKIGTVTLAWIINAYMLGLASMLIVGGRLGDLLGRRKMLFAGVTVFVVASVVCGLAPTGAVLVGARAVQGAAAGFIFTNTLSIVTNAFPSDQRNVGVSFWVGIGAVGSAIGPFVGGLLTELVSWRWFFFLNAPFCIATLAFLLLLIRESRDEESPPKIDWLGCATSIGGLACVVLGLQLAGNVGWTAWAVWLSLAIGVTLLIAFLMIENRVAFPLIDFQLFKSRDFGSCASVGFLINLSLGSLMLFLALYLQHVLNLSPIGAGLVFLGYSVMLAITASSNAFVLNRLGARQTMAAGMLLNGLSFLILVFSEMTTGVAVIVGALVLGGAGQALAYTTSTSLAVGSVSEQKTGAASGIVSMVRMVAVTIGVAISTALFKFLETGAMVSLIGKAGGDLSRAEVRDIHVLVAGSDQSATKLAHDVPAAADEMPMIVDQALMAGFGGVMIMCVAVSIIGLAAAFVARPNKPDAVDD